MIERIAQARRSLGLKLIGPWASLSYSQEGEDRILARIVDGWPPGFYVDVGAHDPRRFSNTYALYLQGWKGLVIDPEQSCIKRFAKVRPRDIAIRAAIAKTAGQRTFHEFDEPALNTLSEERAQEVRETTKYRQIRSTIIHVERLDTILARYLPANQGIDILSVDVEGVDLEVIESNDWRVYRPRVVILEQLHSGSLQAVSDSDVTHVMSELGFIPYAKAVNSVVFVDASERRGEAQPTA